ncbi:MAG: DJ-1/PfpI family protein [Deltaproteobacteria bacterium]|nr:DJ-1/PfpI family protein [Deltaproteobacteria bacterium]
MTETKPLRRLGAVIYDNFELLDLFGPLEMFGNVVPEIKIITVAEQPGPIPSVQGPKTIAEFGFSDCPGLDLILLPGGLGTLKQLKNPAMLGFLKDRASSAEVIMSVCSGTALLAKAGLLDGRRATSNKQFFNLAANQSERVKWVAEARWVEDGPLVTSSGVSAGLDMALAVIARLFGRERAESIANRAEYVWQDDPDRDPFHKFLNRGGI